MSLASLLGCSTDGPSSSIDADASTSTGISVPSLTSTGAAETEVGGEAIHCAAPACGNGRIEALEECDGEPGCDEACARQVDLTSWSLDRELERLVPSADGTELAVLVGPFEHRRYASDGTLIWSVEQEDAWIADLELDADGNGYFAGTTLIFDGAAKGPWLASWSPDGAMRWVAAESSIGAYVSVDADRTRVLVGGSTEQLNSPGGRAMLAQYAPDGALQWSTKLTAYSGVLDVMLSEGGALAIARELGSAHRTLIRVDLGGEVSWARDVPDADSNRGANELFADGRGGAWLAGAAAGRSWAVHFDASGNEVEALDCIGGTEGWPTHVAVDRDGRVAVGVLVSDDPLGLQQSTPWIVLLEGGESQAGYRLDWTGDATLRLFGVSWLPDGTLVVAAEESNPDRSRFTLLEPTWGP